MLTVETWLNEVVITKRLTAPLSGKVKVPENVYMSVLKLPFEAIISATHLLIIYTFVDNLPLTKFLKVVYFV